MNTFAPQQSVSETGHAPGHSFKRQSKGASFTRSSESEAMELWGDQMSQRPQAQANLQFKQALNQRPQVVAQAKLSASLSGRPQFTNPLIQRFKDPESKEEVNIEELTLEKATHYLILGDRGQLSLTFEEYMRLTKRELELLKEKKKEYPVEKPNPVLASKVNFLSDEEISQLSEKEATEYLLLENRGVRIDPSIFIKLVTQELGKMRQRRSEEALHVTVPVETLEEEDVTTSEPARRKVAETAKKNAIETVERVVNNLESAIQHPQVQQHFLRVFQNASVFQTFAKNLMSIASYLKSTHLQINYQPDDTSSANAFTLQGVVTLKKRFFTKLDQLEQQNTVIHEAVHAALDVPDYAYTTERLITSLNPDIAISNPDSYVWFLAGVLEGKIAPKKQITDVFTGEFSEYQKFELSKTIGLETSSILKVQNLFGQAAEDAANAVKNQQGFDNNTIYTIQQVKKVFSGGSQNWDQNRPTEGIVKGLNTISQVLTYLYGGLTAPVTITWTDNLVPKWAREGTGPVSLEIPKVISPGNLYKSLMRNYVKDLLEPIKKEQWKSYYNLIVNVSPNFINLGNYIGTKMEALENEK